MGGAPAVWCRVATEALVIGEGQNDGSSRPSALAVVQGWSRSREHREAALFLRARRRFKDALSQGQRGSGTSPVGGLKGVVLDAESADGTA